MTSTYTAKRKTYREIHYGDRVFLWILRIIAVLVVVLLLSIAFQLTIGSIPALKRFGLAFAFRSVWDPVNEIYGALPVIYGTLVSSFLAILFATPVSLGIALFLNELAPRRVAFVIGFLVEMLAAIPSVVYGLWGFFLLAPFLRTKVDPFIGSLFGNISFFSGPYYGVGMFTAGIILAIMITPTISSICREVFAAIPRTQREAALGLGATRWEMMNLSVLKSSKAGIMGAVILGLGRALGETMAVTMVIGNRSEIIFNLFAPAQTMASVIANEYAEATSDIHLSSLIYVGLLLFVVTFFVNGFARWIIWRVTTPRTAK